MNIKNCNGCKKNIEGVCILEQLKITEVERCPIHDPDPVEELNDTEFSAGLDTEEK